MNVQNTTEVSLLVIAGIFIGAGAQMLMETTEILTGSILLGIAAVIIILRAVLKKYKIPLKIAGK